MYKFFENIDLSNRIAIIISIMTFLYAIIKDHIKGKRYKQVEKRNEEYSNWKKEFEIAVPWRDNGEWIIMPWDMNGLYSL